MHHSPIHMNLVDDQGALGEIEQNEAADRKKEKKGERMGRGKREKVRK